MIVSKTFKIPQDALKANRINFPNTANIKIINNAVNIVFSPYHADFHTVINSMLTVVCLMSSTCFNLCETMLSSHQNLNQFLFLYNVRNHGIHVL